MDVSISVLPSCGGDDGVVPDVAVVIDVLRATSVMATALAAGAARIITCSQIEQAQKFRAEFTSPVLLGGERKCQRIDGFDLGNSPAEYTSEVVRGRTLVITTTNGTRAIEAVQDAGRVITASFLNLSAVVASLQDVQRVRLVCAGTDGCETGEDNLLAGAIAEACRRRYQANIASGTAVCEAWAAFQRQGIPLAEALRETGGGRNLLRFGFESDLDRCSQIDACPIVPRQVAAGPPIFALEDVSG